MTCLAEQYSARGDTSSAAQAINQAKSSLKGKEMMLLSSLIVFID